MEDRNGTTFPDVVAIGAIPAPTVTVLAPTAAIPVPVSTIPAPAETILAREPAGATIPRTAKTKTAIKAKIIEETIPHRGAAAGKPLDDK